MLGANLTQGFKRFFQVSAFVSEVELTDGPFRKNALCTLLQHSLDRRIRRQEQVNLGGSLGARNRVCDRQLEVRVVYFWFLDFPHLKL